MPFLFFYEVRAIQFFVISAWRIMQLWNFLQSGKNKQIGKKATNKTNNRKTVKIIVY